jgi:hypothetical protein
VAGGVRIVRSGGYDIGLDECGTDVRAVARGHWRVFYRVVEGAEGGQQFQRERVWQSRASISEAAPGG